MALINKSAIIHYTLRELLKLPPSNSVGLYSYKRNRKVLLHNLSDEEFLVKVDGYAVSEKKIKKNSIEKELRTIVKREFPRSRKIRFYKFSDIDDEKVSYQKI